MADPFSTITFGTLAAIVIGILFCCLGSIIGVLICCKKRLTRQPSRDPRRARPGNNVMVSLPDPYCEVINEAVQQQQQFEDDPPPSYEDLDDLSAPPPSYDELRPPSLLVLSQTKRNRTNSRRNNPKSTGRKQ